MSSVHWTLRTFCRSWNRLQIDRLTWSPEHNNTFLCQTYLYTCELRYVDNLIIRQSKSHRMLRSRYFSWGLYTVFLIEGFGSAAKIVLYLLKSPTLGFRQEYVEEYDTWKRILEITNWKATWKLQHACLPSKVIWVVKKTAKVERRFLF